MISVQVDNGGISRQFAQNGGIISGDVLRNELKLKEIECLTPAEGLGSGLFIAPHDSQRDEYNVSKTESWIAYGNAVTSSETEMSSSEESESDERSKCYEMGQQRGDLWNEMYRYHSFGLLPPRLRHLAPVERTVTNFKQRARSYTVADHGDCGQCLHFYSRRNGGIPLTLKPPLHLRQNHAFWRICQ